MDSEPKKRGRKPLSVEEIERRRIERENKPKKKLGRPKLPEELKKKKETSHRQRGRPKKEEDAKMTNKESVQKNYAKNLDVRRLYGREYYYKRNGKEIPETKSANGRKPVYH